MDLLDDTEVDAREYGLRIPVDDGCPLRFPDDGRELRLIEAVRRGEAGSVDEIRQY